jgi:hypothetical protein
MSQEQFMRRYQAMAEMYSAFCGGNTESPECWNAGQEWGFYQSTYQNMMVEIQSLRFAEQVVGWSNSCTGQCGIPGTQGYVTCYLAGCDSTHAGARSTFEIGKKTFVVVGGTDSERARAEADMRLIVSTPRGSKMLTELESQRTFFFFKSSFTIDLTAVNNAFVRIGERDAVHIDPTFNPIIQTTIGPIPANSTRVLGHELGHAAFGTKDDGPNKMNNVNQNENVIMNALGQPSRTVY